MHKIRVCGFDPSLRNWGIAAADLDLDSGLLDTPDLSIIQTVDPPGKQVRQNSKDLALAEQLFSGMYPIAQLAKVIFVEVPVGSQSARAMASYGTCVGVLGSLRGLGIQIIEVTPTEVKVSMTGNRNATKDDIIRAAVEHYPDANWPRHSRAGKVGKTSWKAGDLLNSCEHMADAVAAIHAGCATPMFQNLLRILRK